MLDLVSFPILVCPSVSDNTSPPYLYLFAGPNGCGKTTFTRAFFSEQESPPPFLNADEIARGLSPLKPEDANVRAARILLSDLHAHIQARRSFALESTLSGMTYVKMLMAARAAGFMIELHYLRLPSAEMAVQRVRQRVAKGGHFVPSDDIRRRYVRSLSLLREHYLPLADTWFFWNSASRPPVLLADWRNPPDDWSALLCL